MAEAAKTPPVPTAAELVTQLKAKANDWTERFHGQTNHNPHLRVAKLIVPLINELSIKDAKVTPELLAKIAALPKDPEVINPNWQPEPKQPAVLPPTAKSVGEQNIKG